MYKLAGIEINDFDIEKGLSVYCDYFKKYYNMNYNPDMIEDIYHWECKSKSASEYQKYFPNWIKNKFAVTVTELEKYKKY